MAPVLLALAASASWGVSDFLGGLNSRRIPVSTVLALSAPAGLLAIGGVVAIRGEGPPEAIFALYATAGGLAGVVGVAALYRGLGSGRWGSWRRSFLARLVLRERLAPVQLAGAGSALAGVALISAG